MSEWDDARGCNDIPGGATAVGYWGNNIHQRILAEEESARQTALLLSQVQAGGIRSYVWRGVTEGTKCSCYKESNKQADRNCKSCYGIGKVPGYLKFGNKTLWLSSSDTDVVMNGVAVTTDFKSSKIILNEGVNSGYIESGDKPFSRSAIGSVWEQESVFFVREPVSSSVSVSYSLDSGVTWDDISNLPTVNPSSGVIRFRATLNRNASDVLSPLFEVVRARYSTIDLSTDGRSGPWVLIMRTIPFKQVSKYEHGDRPNAPSGLSTFWTTSLRFFDKSIVMNSEDDFLKEGDVFGLLDVVDNNLRYKVTSYQVSDPFAQMIVDQNFTIRIIDPAEPTSLVW